MELIRVLIADDHPLFRDGLRTLLNAVPETEFVGEVATGDEAITQAATLQPDIILMDLHMPGLNGIEATRAILHTSPHIGILVLTMFEDDDSEFSAMRAGARGYLLKGADQAEIVRAITAVSHGEAIFSPSIAGRLVLSQKTVRNHVSNVFSKLQVADRAQAIIRAREAGLR